MSANNEAKTAGIDGGVNRSDGSVFRVAAQTSDTVLTNWDDMIACGMPMAAVSNAYQQKFDCKPDKVHLNDEFCKNYGWLSYNQIGTVKYYNVNISPISKIAAQRVLQNNSDTAVKHQITLSTTMSNSATTSVTTSSSVSVGSKITIGSEALGIGSEFSNTFTLSNEVGSSSTTSTSVTISDSAEVTVPPHSKRTVMLEVVWEERKEDFEMPVFIQSYGLTGAQFPKRVKGHYHWSFSHNAFFTPPFESKLMGSLHASYNTRGTLIVGQVEIL